MKAFSKRIEEQEAQRIDVYLAQAYPEFSRSFLKNLIQEGGVLLNGKKIKAGAKIKQGDLIEMEVPEPETLEIKAEDIPIEIIYQDEDIAVINKPQGMVTHPAPGNFDRTLVNAIMYHIKKPFRYQWGIASGDCASAG